jgi:hypothetical protein
MRQDDEDFSCKSKTYRKDYNQNIAALYGTEKCPALKPRTKPKVKRRIDQYVEASIQIKLVQWAKSEGLDLISIPNAGKRSYWTGQKEVAMGLTAGVSDLFLPYITDFYGGFWIELKTPGKTPRPNQVDWMTKMRLKGYKAEWYDNFDIARDAIIEYIRV